jgi:polysaccharide export outer membrane protein
MLILTSCANKKDILYLQDIEKNKTEQINQTYINKLQPDDILNIIVSSNDNQGVLPFNLMAMASTPGSEGMGVGQPRLLNYVIRQDGNIQFPVLGNVKIAGLSILEAIELLKQKISFYVKDPIVTIEWINFKFTVLGEVKRPGQYKSSSERVTIIDALGIAGDLSIQANRKNIILIREIETNRYIYNIDLTNKNFINSESYFIKQNDQIIVSPNNAQVQASAYNSNAPLYISIASTIISLVTVVALLNK